MDRSVFVFALVFCLVGCGSEGPAGPAGAMGDAGAAGAPGESVVGSAEPPGANCAAGGVKLVSASGTSYVCNGAPGMNGVNGADGTSVTTASEPAGANCPNGGAKIMSASATTFVCNGSAGMNGVNGTNGMNGMDGQSVTSAAEPPGANCVNGGVKLTSASGTTYVCNGLGGRANPVCGVTAPTTGNAGGWAGVRASCKTACSSPSAHICSSDEMLRTLQFGAGMPSAPAWIATARWMVNATLVGGSVQTRSDMFANYRGCCNWDTGQTAVSAVSLPTVSTQVVDNCQGWTSAATTRLGGVSDANAGAAASTCDVSMPIACCDG